MRSCHTRPPAADAPPPADVPTIDRKANAADENLTIREQLALHRDNASCAGCHKTIDPLGFALENFDPVGQWREQYENGKPVNASGVLYNQHAFDGIVELKSALLTEQERFAFVEQPLFCGESPVSEETPQEASVGTLDS